MPSGENRPSIAKEPRLYLRLEWFRLKLRVVDFLGWVGSFGLKASLVVLLSISDNYIELELYLGNMSSLRSLPLGQQLLSAALVQLLGYCTIKCGQLLQSMYLLGHSASFILIAYYLSSRDVAVLRSICADGLYDLLASKIAARPRDETRRWTSHASAQRPRVVSHRAIMLPMVPRSALRQAVVQLKTKQSLDRILPDGRIMPGTGKVENVTEYIVIEKRIINEKEDGWIIWGTVEESDWRAMLNES